MRRGGVYGRCRGIISRDAVLADVFKFYFVKIVHFGIKFYHDQRTRNLCIALVIIQSVIKYSVLVWKNTE
jgi:hypothetical protein